MPTSAVLRSTLSRQWMGEPFSDAPWPCAALNSSSVVGTKTAPATGPLSLQAAMETPQPGRS